MSGLNKNRRRDETRRLRPFAALRGFARRFAGDKRANVLIMFGLTLPILLAIVAGGIDFSYAEGAKSNLQDASDAASLAVSAEVVLHPNDTVQTLQTLATATLKANDGAGAITSFQVCAPIATSSNCSGMANNTVNVTAQASAPCIPVPIPTTVCRGSPPMQTVTTSSTTVLGFGATLQLNVVMDSSGSMIVGATPGDVAGIATWTGQEVDVPVYTNECTGGRHSTCQEVQTGTTQTYPNWASIKPSDPGPTFSGDNPPCAFACHDEGDSTTAADMAQGLVNAHAATNAVTGLPVQTRFDVMISAAQALVNHVQAETQGSSTLAKNTYVFNIYSFDTSIHKYGGSNLNFSQALTQVGNVAPGLDTYLNESMATFAGTGTNSIGANGTGASTASPLKFMILVTDGLESSRDSNWNSPNGTLAHDPNFGPYPTFNPANGAYPTSADNARANSSQLPLNIKLGGFAGPITAANCTTLKNEGVVLAVLETPYVPLDGQDGHVQPYEQTVRHVIYPSGAAAGSVVSTALQACASTGYYFQAVNSSDIQTGFLALTDKFVQHSAYISQ